MSIIIGNAITKAIHEAQSAQGLAVARAIPAALDSFSLAPVGGMRFPRFSPPTTVRGTPGRGEIRKIYEKHLAKGEEYENSKDHLKAAKEYLAAANKAGLLYEPEKSPEVREAMSRSIRNFKMVKGDGKEWKEAIGSLRKSFNIMAADERMWLLNNYEESFKNSEPKEADGLLADKFRHEREWLAEYNADPKTKKALIELFAHDFVRTLNVVMKEDHASETEADIAIGLLGSVLEYLEPREKVGLIDSVFLTHRNELSQFLSAAQKREDMAIIRLYLHMIESGWSKGPDGKHRYTERMEVMPYLREYQNAIDNLFANKEIEKAANALTFYASLIIYDGGAEILQYEVDKILARDLSTKDIVMLIESILEECERSGEFKTVYDIITNLELNDKLKDLKEKMPPELQNRLNLRKSYNYGKMYEKMTPDQKKMTATVFNIFTPVNERNETTSGSPNLKYYRDILGSEIPPDLARYYIEGMLDSFIEAGYDEKNDAQLQSAFEGQIKKLLNADKTIRLETAVSLWTKLAAISDSIGRDSAHKEALEIVNFHLNKEGPLPTDLITAAGNLAHQLTSSGSEKEIASARTIYKKLYARYKGRVNIRAANASVMLAVTNKEDALKHLNRGRYLYLTAMVDGEITDKEALNAIRRTNARIENIYYKMNGGEEAVGRAFVVAQDFCNSIPDNIKDTDVGVRADYHRDNMFKLVQMTEAKDLAESGKFIEACSKYAIILDRVLQGKSDLTAPNLNVKAMLDYARTILRYMDHVSTQDKGTFQSSIPVLNGHIRNMEKLIPWLRGVSGGNIAGKEIGRVITSMKKRFSPSTYVTSQNQIARRAKAHLELIDKLDKFEEGKWRKNIRKGK